jgi:biopolymer transport protein ExbB
MNIVAKSKSIMLAMGAAPIMYLMIALSVISLAIILERTWFFASIKDDLETLARDLHARLRNRDFEGAKTRLLGSKSAEAAVVVAGLAEADRGADAASESMAGATALQRMKLEKRLAYLGTLGNNAPFIGLFGTVIGIIEAFEHLGKATNAAAGAGAPTEVMSSIAEALVATAIGLAVAIPAVAAFNYFQRKIKATIANTDVLSRVLLAHLKGEEHGGKRSGDGEAKSSPSSQASVVDGGPISQRAASRSARTSHPAIS